MAVDKKKEEEVKQRMKNLGIKQEDLIEKFILGSGNGGQKLNKTASCVYLKHLPTGIEVKSQEGRSQQLNRFFARRKLCDQMTAKIYQQKTSKEKDQEKIRRQKKRRQRRLKSKRQSNEADSKK